MAQEKDKEIKKEDQETKRSESDVKPDPETLNTTDPQEEMKGPLSSLTRNVSNALKSKESKDDADERKDKRM